MQPGLREAQLGRVDATAARERAGVEYLVGLIEANEAALRDAFVPEGTAEEEVPELLYGRVSSTFDGLAALYTRPFGVTVTYMTPDQTGADEPVVRLGWAVYSPALPGKEDCPKDKKFPHVLRLTEEGLTVINGLRGAQGYVTLQEQQRLNRERWDGAMRAADTDTE